MYYFARIIFISLLSLSLLSAKDINKNYNHIFTIDKGTTLFLENGDGDVNIQTWDKDQIKVDIVYHVKGKSSSSSDDYEFNVDFRQNGDRVYIIGKEHRKSTFGFFSIHYIDYSYKIKAPSYLHLDIIGDDGDIIIENINGKIKSKTSDGNMTLRNIDNDKTSLKSSDGDIRVESSSGEIYARTDDGSVFLKELNADEAEISSSDGRIKIINSSGDFFVDSDDGDVTLYNISGKTLNVRTQDGDVDINFAGSGEVNIDISTDDGRVKFELNNSVSAEFVLETDDGTIRFDVDKADIARESSRRIKGDLGAGAGRIRINTNDGSITMHDSYN